MHLGNKPPFATSWEPFHKWLMGFCPGRYWPTQRYARFHERIGWRRYRAGPVPWTPGRYRTAQWHPSGYGRFSGIRERLQGAYNAERYTGVRIRTEDYFKRHGQPGEYEAQMERTRRKTSWRCAA